MEKYEDLQKNSTTSKSPSLFFWLLLSFSIISFGLLISLKLTERDLFQKLVTKKSSIQLNISNEQRVQLYASLYKFKDNNGVKSYKKVDNNYYIEAWGPLLNATENELTLTYEATNSEIDISYLDEINVEYPASAAFSSDEKPNLSLFEGQTVKVTAMLSEDGSLVAKTFNFAPVVGEFTTENTAITQSILDSLPEKYSTYPVEQIPLLSLVDKTKGASFIGDGIFYYLDRDNVDGLILIGLLNSWDAQTLTVQFKDGSSLSLQESSQGVLGLLGDAETGVVSETGKAYYINRNVAISLDVINGGFIANNITVTEK